MVGDDFTEWREKARALLAARVAPADVLWAGEAEPSLFAGEEQALPPVSEEVPRVSKEFLRLAEMVSHHASDERWPLLYRTLFRMTWGAERDLLKISSDPDVSRLLAMRKSIGRDIHKMHAFVRFQKVGETEEGRERFISWFEPEHRIMPLTAGFFKRRFTGMDWSIFTPTGSAHWISEELSLGPGIEKPAEITGDSLDELWRSYYKSIFNPARIKVKAMQAEMPKKYWKNLPEADLIDELIAGGGHRVAGMLETEERPARELKNNAYINRLQEMTERQEAIVTEPETFVGSDLKTLRKAAAACQACPLYENATATVFGQGPEDADIMIVGEQPGDQEDLAGEPFIGPAGRVLDEALVEAGIDREKAYLTNAVKHFKWKARGKMRLHQNPAASEVSRCKPWLIAEVLQVQPRTLILLGATAAKSLLGRDFKITKERGLVERPDLAPKVIATVHPSYLLRLPDKKRAAEERALFVSDLML